MHLHTDPQIESYIESTQMTVKLGFSASPLLASSPTNNHICICIMLVSSSVTHSLQFRFCTSVLNSYQSTMSQLLSPLHFVVIFTSHPHGYLF